MYEPTQLALWNSRAQELQNTIRGLARGLRVIKRVQPLYLSHSVLEAMAGTMNIIVTMTPMETALRRHRQQSLKK
jgi:hypothetical protein